MFLGLGTGLVSPAVLRQRGGAAPPATPFVWDTSNAFLAYSNGNRTVASLDGYAWQSTRASVSKSSGKWYAEIELTSEGSGHLWLAGLVDSGFVLADYLSSSEKSAAWGGPGPTAPATASFTPTASFPATRPVAGGRIMIAIDLDAGKAWLGHTGTWTGDPAAGTGHWVSFAANTDLFVAVSTYGIGESSSFTLPASLSYSAPSGFTALNA